MNENRPETDEIEIDLLEVAGLLLHRAKFIIAMTLIVAVLTCGVTFAFITPKYTATAMMYVNNSSFSLGNTNFSISSGELSAAQSLVDTYVVILKSRTCLESIIQQCALEYDYSTLLTEFKRLGESIAVIATSNITSTAKPFDYVMDYAKLLDSDRVIEDNSLIMFLNALSECDIKSVALAGFDGFGSSVNESYYDDGLELSTNYKRLASVNRKIADKIPLYRERMDLSFLTPSRYESEAGK